ncbi:MAG TPA: universal stress protein [Alphaproteobacteria bacterium]
MSYKDILVIADDATSAPVRYDVAAAVGGFEAHLVALHVMEPPYTPASLTQAAPSALLEWQESVIQERLQAAKRMVDEAQQRNGVNFEWRQVRGTTVDVALQHGQYADLIIASQATTDEDTVLDIMPEELIMGAGRPVLLVPRYGKFPRIAERVLIAWNRTREAARAVHDALPLLKRAQSVRVMEVNPKGDHIAGADLATHLARHGVQAEVGSATASDMKIGDVILSRAADLGADLLVMGAYGHSRLREYTFGGVTLHILRHMTIPVLMSH